VNTLTKGAPAAGIGHNQPPPAPFDLYAEIKTLLDPEILWDQLEMDNKDRLTRKVELLASGAKVMELYGKKGIPNDVEAGKVADLMGMMGRTADATEAIRKTVGKPMLDATEVVNRFFKHTISDPLWQASRKGSDLQKLLTRYGVDKAAREKQQREDEARAAREEADRVAKEALKSGAREELKQAYVADDAAQQAEIAANAPQADLSRVRGDMGTNSSLREEWVFEVANLAEVPREWLMLDESKVRAAIRRKDDPVRDIPGLTIKAVPQMRVR
jgi:hypothetical protein